MLKNKEKKIILASQSPRRQKLMRDAGFEFEVKTKSGIEEVFPQGLKKEEIAKHLAKLKAHAFAEELSEHTIIITADTIVWQKGEVLGKPESKQEAFRMIKRLSGKKHWVITGVCITSVEKQKLFHSSAKVYFDKLTDEEINYYIENYKPYDKAGAYGIQEWIGHIGIEKIKGSYFNVMGLPIHQLYKEIKQF